MENFCYNIIAQSFFNGQDIQADPQCNGWTAINKGDTLLIVNGVKLKPFPPGHPELSGESFGVAGNLGELFKGRITLVVDSSGGGVAPELLLVQKYYIKK